MKLGITSTLSIAGVLAAGGAAFALNSAVLSDSGATATSNVVASAATTGDTVGGAAPGSVTAAGDAQVTTNSTKVSDTSTTYSVGTAGSVIIDTASGTVRVKAEVDNRQDRWWPGAYVKVRLSLQTVVGGTVIPLPAIVNSARGRSVFVVDAEGVAQPRPVEVLTSADGLASVKGISPGDRVVVEGRQNLRPGTKVQERSPDKGSAKPGKAAG